MVYLTIIGETMYVEQTICWKDISGSTVCLCLKCKSCRRKKPRSQSEAQDRAIFLNMKRRNNQRKVRSYRCLFCEFFHVGHTPNKKRMKNIKGMVKSA